MNTTRRQVLRAASAAAASTLVPTLWTHRASAAAARSLKVSTFGGYFERMFAEHVYPAFTKATGIAVQSLEQPEGAQFLLQLAAANKAGKPPMDVGCILNVDVMRGRALNLWRTFERAKMANVERLFPNLATVAGPFDNVAAMSWYMTLVVNPDEIKPPPD